MASNAMITKPKINPRKIPPKNIAKAMAVTPCLDLRVDDADGPGNQDGETLTPSFYGYYYCYH
jgi:hypothetical protein